MVSILAIIIVVLGILLLFFARSQDKNNRQNWKNFASKHNLSLIEGGFFGFPFVRGSYRGVEIHLRQERRGIGRNKYPFTVLDAFIKHPPSHLTGLSIYKEGFLSKISKAIGCQDIEIGDPKFDQAMIIECINDKHAVRAYLKPPLKRAIMTMIQTFPEAQFTQKACHLERRGVISNVEKLEKMFDLMTTCCKLGNTNSIDDKD